MSATALQSTVSEIYDAFGRGDVPAILDRLSDDVAWESWEHPKRAEGVPWLVERRGHNGAAEFFGALGGMDIHDFAVLDVIAGDRQVAAEVFLDATVRSTGQRFQDEELHLWTFGDDGRVTRFRHYVDTAKHLAAVGA
jgi:ketosteroid isomerase-like protein